MKFSLRPTISASGKLFSTAAATGIAAIAGGIVAQESQNTAGPLVAKPVGVPAVTVVTQEKPLTAVSAVPIPDPSVEAAEPVPTLPKAPMNYRSERSLSDFLTAGDGMTLKNVTDVRRLSVPVPWRAKWPEMRIDLRYQNSGALLSGRSQLELWWAGGMVAQKALDGNAADGRLLAEIPNRQIRPGAHMLELRALHQSGEGAGDPFGEDLWTQIDASASSVALSHQLRSLTPVLSDLPRLMDRYGWEPFQLRLMTAEPWALTGIHLEWISRVVERSALMLESVPLEITHGSALAATGDHFVIGLREEIAPLLPESIAAEITESFAGIFPHPEDDRFFIAVISGGTREGIEKAIRVFAATEFVLPPEAVLDLTNFSIPELPPGPPLKVLTPGEERSFAQLGSSTWELQGLSTGRTAVPVHLPPGIGAAGSAKLKLELRMAWSPVRSDATVDVFVDGNREATIPIGKGDATRFDGYEMELPLSSFHPGKNLITFQANLIPPGAVAGKPVNWDSLRFVLDDGSHLKMPVVDREIKLPDLQLTARSGIPAVNVGSEASPQPFVVFMSERESAGLSAGCMLLGKFTQTAGRRIPLARLSFEMPPGDSNFVAVGSEESLPSELIPAAADFQLSEPDRALVTQFESPLKEGRIGMAVVAAIDARVADAVRRLILPEQWNRLTGDTAILSESGDGVSGRPIQFGSLTVFHDAASERHRGNGFSAGWIPYSLALFSWQGAE